MIVIYCIDSTAYSFFTNPVYVSWTSNNLRMISFFSLNFLGKSSKITWRQTRRSSILLLLHSSKIPERAQLINTTYRINSIIFKDWSCFLLTKFHFYLKNYVISFLAQHLVCWWFFKWHFISKRFILQLKQTLIYSSIFPTDQNAMSAL